MHDIFSIFNVFALRFAHILIRESEPEFSIFLLAEFAERKKFHPFPPASYEFREACQFFPRIVFAGYEHVCDLIRAADAVAKRKERFVDGRFVRFLIFDVDDDPVQRAENFFIGNMPVGLGNDVNIFSSQKRDERQ